MPTERIDANEELVPSDACLHLENQLCFPLYACARKVVGLYTPYFKPLGITYTQYIVLLVLWQEDHIPVGDLCRKLYLDNGTMTPLLKKMEEHGILTRTRSTQDERVVVVDLTEKGRELKQKALEIPGNIAPCMKLSGEEAQTLYKLLYKIIEMI